MHDSFHDSPSSHKANGESQDVISLDETLALIELLALGNQEIEAGKVKPLADVASRLLAMQVA